MKAFECLSNDLSLARLNVYRLTDYSINLLRGYLSNRKPRLKIGNNCSEWQNIAKGVTLNETTMYNYADDNTLCEIGESIENVKSHLVSMTKIVTNWFKRKCMQANPENLQAICLPHVKKKMKTDFSIDNINIQSERSVQLLGVEN